jgi:hypothetical protein
MTRNFSDILSTFENVDHLQALELLNADGSLAGLLENKPGSQGSLRLYHHLWKKWGSISVEAARQGLELYAEHTEDARQHPGKHPNIDRLFAIIDSGQPLSVNPVPVGIV